MISDLESRRSHHSPGIGHGGAAEGARSAGTGVSDNEPVLSSVGPPESMRYGTILFPQNLPKTLTRNTLREYTFVQKHCWLIDEP